MLNTTDEKSQPINASVIDSARSSG